MVTRGIVTVNAAKGTVFEALLSACKDMDADIKHSDSSSYIIDGKSGTIWLQNRFSFKFHARLLDANDGVLVEVFDFSPFQTDRTFIGRLFDKLKTKLSTSEPSYSTVEEVWDPKPISSPTFPGKSADTVPPTESTAPTLSGGPFMLDEEVMDAPAAKDTGAGSKVENPQASLQPGGVACPNCNLSAPPGASFCSRCGSKLGSVCPKCKRENPPGSRFCRHCGAGL